MLNQEDKRFIIKVITQAVTDSEGRTNAKIDELRTELKDEIHQQGILLEHLNDKIDLVAENTVGANRRIAVLEEHAGIG
ncbi:hypothetical protein HZA43_05655 [Candidatus Peregrinibacteria bacterium]|nr:hypothetical protein [Candidatus Peregrinibacteria bacterium]